MTDLSYFFFFFPVPQFHSQIVVLFLSPVWHDPFLLRLSPKLAVPSIASLRGPPEQLGGEAGAALPKRYASRRLRGSGGQGSPASV